MKFAKYAVLPLALASLTGCGSDAEPDAAATQAALPTPSETASTLDNQVEELGVSERDLLDMNLVTADGEVAGEVMQVRRGAMGEANGVLARLEDGGKAVLVRMDDLSMTGEGNDRALETTLTAEELAALPEASTRAM
ncbi:hypothetical protein [Aurantiacibacter spongiae]|uniref:PRC-barrel domain-containing protein n=1 Tax=Aurantiacibacter spongiae TaxID=2488860 RepID=A0A3N5D981_9SPHN|nr:hypothetical protein [Aurantiacibacter spongiae]RPF71158.1 hypothetical protein EG799_05675 [Aurantiacibacter spongiae]